MKRVAASLGEGDTLAGLLWHQGESDCGDESLATSLVWAETPPRTFLRPFLQATRRSHARTPPDARGRLGGCAGGSAGNGASSRVQL